MEPLIGMSKRPLAKGRSFASPSKKQFSFILTFLSLIIAVYYFISSGLHFQISGYIHPHQDIEALFNSNQLFLPYFYQDIFIHHSPFSDWTLSSVPFFFPDGLIFFIIVSCFHHINTAVLLSNASMLIFYYWLIVSIGKDICGNQAKNIFRMSALLCIVLGCSHLRDQEILLPLWSSHFGSTVIIFLACLKLILILLREPLVFQKTHPQAGTRPAPTRENLFKIGVYSVLLGIILFLTTLSDPFFFVVLISSTFGGLLALFLHKKITATVALLLFLLLLLPSGLGFLSNSFDWFHLHITSFFNVKMSGVHSTFHSFLQPLQILHKMFSLYYQYNPMIVMFALGFMIIGIKFVLFDTKLNNSALFIIVCTCFCFLSTIICTLFLDKDIFRVGFLSLRHFQPSLLFPTFLCLPILLSQSKVVLNFVSRYYGCLLLLLIGCLILFQPIQTPKEIIDVYPPLTRCLDNYAKQDKLLNKNGIGTYWDVRTNNILSKEHIHLVAVNRYKKSYNWMATKHDYEHTKFHFIIVREPTFPAASVMSTWGKPDAILRCTKADNYQIFVYNAGFYIVNSRQ